MTRRMFFIAILSALMLIVAACDEIEPEQVVDEPADDAPATTADDTSDDATDDVVATDDEATDETATDGDDAVVEETDDDELEEAEGFTVGDTVRMGDLVMHLHSVRWDEGSEFMSPDEGMRWLVADIEIENEADSPTTISSLMMFDLVDEDNRSRDLELMADTEGSLDGELGAGRSMRGDLAFEVRQEQTEWELIFTPQLFGFGQAIFDITEGDF